MSAETISIRGLGRGDADQQPGTAKPDEGERLEAKWTRTT